MSAVERNSPAWQLLKAWQQGQTPLAPVATLLNIEPLEFSEGFARIGMPAGATHHNAFGTVHGGLFCAFADIAMGIALATVLGDDEGLTTLAQQMDHLRTVRESRVVATARVVRRGRAAAHLGCDIEDADDRLVARATSVCLISR